MSSRVSPLVFSAVRKRDMRSPKTPSPNGMRPADSWFSPRTFFLTAVLVCALHLALLGPMLRAHRGPPCPGEEDKPFVFYRLIGNNMPPLQSHGQLLANTLYALKHEPRLKGCTKRWVLNQIINATERGLLLDALLAHGYSLNDVIIRPLNVTKVGLAPKKTWVDVVTAQNEARNVAIEDGIKLGARWILPFDGNHFITEESWEAILRSADSAEKKGYQYFKVPVHRLHAEQDPSWVSGSTRFADVIQKAPIMIESQLAFRSDATHRFQEGMEYGKQNKLELLGRACGSPGTLGYKETCGCADLGLEGQPHKSNVTIAGECGYSLRLWFYPCDGTIAHKVFNDGLYRVRIRSAARKELANLVKKIVRDPSLLEY